MAIANSHRLIEMDNQIYGHDEFCFAAKIHTANLGTIFR